MRVRARGILAVTAVLAVGLLGACGRKDKVQYKDLLDEDPQIRSDAARRLGQAMSKDAVDSLQLEGMHEPAVAHPVLPHGGIDTRNP